MFRQQKPTQNTAGNQYSITGSTFCTLLSLFHNHTIAMHVRMLCLATTTVWYSSHNWYNKSSDVFQPLYFLSKYQQHAPRTTNEEDRNDYVWSQTTVL